MKFDLSIVIVNYNVRAFLEQCLIAVDRARHNLRVEIFVVDNASVDGSQAMVKRRFPYVKLIENSENLGFSRANNQALKQINGRYVLILNPDTLIQEDTLIVLKAFLDTHPEVGAVGCKLINPDGSFQIGSRRSLPTPWVAFTRIVGLSKLFPHSRVFGRYNLTYLDPETAGEVDVLSGSLMLIREEVFREIGGFDEDYFMYGEDIDLCYRIKKAGWKIFYTPETKAIHYKGESTKKGELSAIANFYSTMLIFMNKHFKGRYSIFLQMILKTGIYLRAVFAYIWQLLKNFSPPLFDLTLIILSIVLAVKLWLPHYSIARFRVVLPIYTFIWLFTNYIFGVYHPQGRFHLKPILWSTIFGLLINSTFTYFFKQFAYSRVVVLISFAFIIITLSIWRFIYRISGPGSKGSPLSHLRRAIIIGAGNEGKRILKKLRDRPDMLYEVCGFVDFDPKKVGMEIDGTEVLATIDHIRDVIRVERINDVIFSSDRLSNAQIVETIVRARGTNVNFRIVPHQVEYIVAKSSVDEIDTVPMLDITGFSGPVDILVKRLFDIFVSLIVIVISSPLFLCNFLFGGHIVKRTIFGDRGIRLKINLFQGGIQFLRRLPLFLDVLTGKLSIVGSEFIDYDPGRKQSIYKPGLTGIVQLKKKEKGRDLTQKQKDYYNLYYIKNQSIVTDLQIILKALF